MNAQISETAAFVEWFRAAAPYIHAFRGKTFVIAFGGDTLLREDFVDLIHDVNLLNALGVRLVLVHGVRPQVEARLAQRGLSARYVKGLRVTDSEALACVKEAVGAVRVEIETLLSLGLPNTPMAGAEIRVASGNYVIAQPAGVVGGVDTQFTGQVRKVNNGAIRERVSDGDIVLLSPLGYSPTGEVFNLTLEEVATATAVAIGADKLIFILDHGNTVNADGERIDQLTAAEAQKMARSLPDGDMKLYLPHAARACKAGVARVHLVSADAEGALLVELFTHGGVGTMVTRESVDILRPANIDDVGGILQLIEPLEADGTLVRRERERLEQEIGQFIVNEFDGRIVGCVALYPFTDAQSGEMACLAVDPDFRDGGRGAALLDSAVTQAKKNGLKHLFVLTTRTTHWFIEHGFTLASPDDLPSIRKEMYNWQRRSKVLVKALS
ncbi:MAG: amino-acid N-acetyltransferase [Betaproteobacteria bacterium]|nr:amino-acid N-acetyltransferase [Betaproteobacteria bacterium]